MDQTTISPAEITTIQVAEERIFLIGWPIRDSLIQRNEISEKSQKICAINLLKLSLQTNFFYQRENFWSKYENRMAEFILKDSNLGLGHGLGQTSYMSVELWLKDCPGCVPVDSYFRSKK